jgi:hypothetical protein
MKIERRRLNILYVHGRTIRKELIEQVDRIEVARQRAKGVGLRAGPPVQNAFNGES